MAISQRISLEGSEKVRQQLVTLGQTGEQAFTQIQDAAKKPIGDPAQIEKTRQAVDGLATATQGLGAALASTSAKFALAIGALAAAVTAATSAMTKGAVETGQKIKEQADAVGLSISQWTALSKAISATGGSADEVIKGMGKLSEVIKNASSSISGFRDVTVQTDDGAKSIRVFTGYVKDTGTAAGKAAEALRELGVSASTIASGDNLAIMQAVAAAIDKIPNAAERANRGLLVFGKNWEQIIKALTAGQVAADKAFRSLSAPDIEKTVKLKAAWDDLGNAIRAVKDRIGALFLDPALARAQWLTNLIDGAHKLFLEWSKLSGLKRELFVADLGGGPAETIFKILIALGQQLAGIWRDLLVPAGQKLMQIVAGISDSIEGITGSQIAAFFITAAAAAAALAIALKGISLLLTPISLLLSLFSPFGAILLAAAAAAILFWDQFKAGAQAALALIPQEVAQVQEALGALLRGDFVGFWNAFSAAAVSAFQKIRDAIMQDQGPLGELARGIATFAQQLPAAIQLVVQAILTIGQAAGVVATIINTLTLGFTKLTGTDVVILAIAAAFSGVLAAMAAVATIIGGLSAAVAALVAVFGGLPVAIGAATIAIIALFAAFDFQTLANAAVGAFTAILGAIQAANRAVGEFVIAMGGIVWDAISGAGVAAWNAITSAIGRAIDAIRQFIGLKSSAGSDGGGEGGGVPMARGGLLGGRGTGTSDSNLAWLSRGEYITPARAVRQPGVLAFLEALRRSGGNLRGVLDDMGHFARGGLVLPVPAFAAGGVNAGRSSSRVLHLTIGSETFRNLSVPENTALSLERFAVHSQIASTGRKPSWRR